MKKILFVVTILIISMLIVGCGGSDTAVGDETADTNLDKKGSDVKTDNADADQALVNFKCVIGDNIQEYYFLENKIKLKSPSSEGWIIDDIHYVKITINGEDYLVTGMTSAESITNEDMIDMYKTSKLTPNLECTLGSVTEDVVTLPDLEIISNEEMADKMMEGMFTEP